MDIHLIRSIYLHTLHDSGMCNPLRWNLPCISPDLSIYDFYMDLGYYNPVSFYDFVL